MAAHAGPANGVGEESEPAKAAAVDITQRACPADMIEIVGEHCPEIEQHCLVHVPKEKGAPDRCAQFAQSKCKAAKVRKHFCIDPYEFPNKRGEKPAVMKSWQEGHDLC